MPDSNLETAYDLRKPGARAELEAEARQFIKAQGKQNFTARALAEACECNMPQARALLATFIDEGTVDYEGATRGTVYRRVSGKR